MVRQAVTSNEAAPTHGHTTRRKSSVWKHFDYVDVPGASPMATCKRCGSTYGACSITQGTSHLWRHAKSSSCAERAAVRAAKVAAMCLPAAAPAGGDDNDEWSWSSWGKRLEDLHNDPEYDPGLFSTEEQQDGGLATTHSPQLDGGIASIDSPFIDGRQVDGGGEVAAAGDHDRRFPNFMPDTRMPQAQSSSSMRFFQKKRERFANFASHQGGTTDKDHSSCVNTDLAPTVENSMVDTDFTFGDAYD